MVEYALILAGMAILVSVALKMMQPAISNTICCGVHSQKEHR